MGERSEAFPSWKLRRFVNHNGELAKISDVRQRFRVGPNLGGIEWWGYDDKISAFSGREGNRSVDLEVVLSPETMAMLKIDTEFMQYESRTV